MEQALHDEEEVVFANSGYRGVEKRQEIQYSTLMWVGRNIILLGKRKALNKTKPAVHCGTSWKNSRPAFRPR